MSNFFELLVVELSNSLSLLGEGERESLNVILIVGSFSLVELPIVQKQQQQQKQHQKVSSDRQVEMQFTQTSIPGLTYKCHSLFCMI